MIRALLFTFVFLFFCVSVYCGNAEEQMRQSGDMVRSVCQPKHKISDDQVLAAREGKFTDDKPLKCYIQCVLEMMGMMKKNKILIESTKKQFDALLPDEYKEPLFSEPWKHALDVCKDSSTGVKNPCDAAMSFVKCFHTNNPKFTFA